MTTLATELTDEEIRDVQEMGVKLQEFVLDSAEDEELQATHDEDSSAQLPTELEKRPKASETDVDDIMSDSFTLASAVDCSQNDRSDVKESERHRETSLPLDDDDDDDENDMKELLRFKRQNSRDYLEQAPIDGLLEGIAEEPEDEGTKEIEEEYDSVVIKDEEDESGSVSDAANDTGKETEESEAVDNPSPSVVDVVTSDEAVTATVVDVDGEDDVEVPLDAIQTAEPCDLHEPQNGEFSEDDVVDHTTEVSSQKQETEEGEGLTVSAEPAVEPMDTTTSPSSSGTTSDENAATFDVAKGSDKASADELTITTSQSKNRNHDYVNIGDLDAPSNDLDAETVRRAAKAEISDEDFCFDETPTKSSERPDASCDYVNVDTIRANKRLVSRMIQEGNDEEFERLEAEIISKLEDEEDSDYCVPKSTPVEAKSGDTELKQFADINGSAATDENENLSLSGHQDLLAADVALADETSNLPETLKSLDNTRNEEFKEDEQTSDISASVKEFGQWTCEKTSKENGSSEQAVDSDDEIIINYKHHESQKAISIHEQEKMLREEIESCRDDLSLKESFGLQHVKKSNLKSDHSRLASPAYETSSGVRTNDILPEAGSVKALVAQWQQMESKRWSRKDDMKVQNGGEQAESRGMNRFANCPKAFFIWDSKVQKSENLSWMFSSSFSSS